MRWSPIIRLEAEVEIIEHDRDRERADIELRPEVMPLNEASDRFERQIVLRTLDRVDGNVSEAARLLGLHRNSLKAKLDRWKVRARDLGGDGAQ